jgi:hypothetical protein
MEYWVMKEEEGEGKQSLDGLEAFSNILSP